MIERYNYITVYTASCQRLVYPCLLIQSLCIEYVLATFVGLYNLAYISWVMLIIGLFLSIKSNIVSSTSSVVYDTSTYRRLTILSIKTI